MKPRDLPLIVASTFMSAQKQGRPRSLHAAAPAAQSRFLRTMNKLADLWKT